MRDILTAGLTALGLDTAAAPQLERYAALLLEKNKVMNLTAITDSEQTIKTTKKKIINMLRYSIYKSRQQ